MMSEQTTISSAESSIKADVSSATTPPLIQKSDSGKKSGETINSAATSSPVNPPLSVPLGLNSAKRHMGFGSRSPFSSTSIDGLGSVFANLSLNGVPSTNLNGGSPDVSVAAASFLSDTAVTAGNATTRVASNESSSDSTQKGVGKTSIHQESVDIQNHQQHQSCGWSSILPELAKTPEQGAENGKFSTPLTADPSVLGFGNSPSPFMDGENSLADLSSFRPSLSDHVARRLTYPLEAEEEGDRATQHSSQQQQQQQQQQRTQSISESSSPVQTELSPNAANNTFGGAIGTQFPLYGGFNFENSANFGFSGYNYGRVNEMGVFNPSAPVNMGQFVSGSTTPDLRESGVHGNGFQNLGGSTVPPPMTNPMVPRMTAPTSSGPLGSNIPPLSSITGDSSRQQDRIPGQAIGNSLDGSRRRQSNTHRKRGSGKRRGEDAARFMNATLADFTNEIYYLCKDQHGCRFLQRQLEIGGSQAATKIFNEIQLNVIELMIDPFGNYLIQKLLERVDEHQRTVLVRNASSQFVRIALDPHGTRALQKLVECVTTQEEFDIIVKSLSSYVVLLSRDLNGNHVVQKCLQKLPADSCDFIFDAACDNCLKIAKHRHGCCVLQRCFDHGTPKQCERLSLKVGEHCVELSTDPYGNYVVQYVLSMEETRLRAQHDPASASSTPNTSQAIHLIISALRDNLVSLSTHKFGSNVVEKSLRIPTLAPILIGQLLKDSNNPVVLLHDAYGNYVLQTTLDVADDASFRQLSEMLRPAIPDVRNTPHGRRILSKLISRGGASSSASFGYAAVAAAAVTADVDPSTASNATGPTVATSPVGNTRTTSRIESTHNGNQHGSLASSNPQLGRYRSLNGYGY